MNVDAVRLTDAALTLSGSAAACDWRGPDAYDGLWFDWPPPLVGGRRRRQAIMQLHARAPLDVRKLYRRRHPLIPKALGIFGSVGLRVHRLTGDQEALAVALRALDTLAADHTAGDLAWGYHWDMQTRWSFYPAGSPNVVVTAFACSALLEAERDAGRRDLGDRAREAARWALDELWCEADGYFAYHPGNPANIHNANLLGAWLVHVAAGDSPLARERIARAVDRTLEDQNPDGSWPYGEGPSLKWVDSFHSGYALTVLDRLRDVDVRVDAAVRRGTDHYRRFFDAAGRARLWADRPYPEDAHAAGTGLTTLATLYRRGLVERELLERVAIRTLDTGLRDGHAVYRRYRRHSTHVNYLRWADAHVALGLADAAASLLGAGDGSPVAPSAAASSSAGG